MSYHNITGNSPRFLVLLAPNAEVEEVVVTVVVELDAGFVLDG